MFKNKDPGPSALVNELNYTKAVNHRCTDSKNLPEFLVKGIVYPCDGKHHILNAACNSVGDSVREMGDSYRMVH